MYYLYFTTRFINTAGTCPQIKKEYVFVTEEEAHKRLHALLTTYNRKEYAEPRYKLCKMEILESNMDPITDYKRGVCPPV